ncbi:MAG: hypothetical protein U0359_18305 [Byssovorax sp.]
MHLGRLLDELCLAAESAGIRVRTDAFDPNLSDVKRPRGGLVTLRGDKVILVDGKLPLPERIATMATALAELNLDHLALPHIVRATIGAYRRGAGKPDLPPAFPANDDGLGQRRRVAPLARTRPEPPVRGRKIGD